MTGLDISGILTDFPETRIALIVARDMEMAAPRTPALDAALAGVEAEAAAFLAGRPLAEIPELQVWRRAYKAFGVKKTSYRSSVERLLKQIQQGRGLPRVSALVDCYNAISLRHRLPIGADDLDKVTGDLAFRRSRPEDDFFALGAVPATVLTGNDPPKPGEVVYADAGKLLCRRWNWYQDARSATGPTTRHAVLTVQWLGGGMPLEPAVAEACTWLAEHCQADTAWAIAEAGTPRVEVG